MAESTWHLADADRMAAFYEIAFGSKLERTPPEQIVGLVPGDEVELCLEFDDPPPKPEAPGRFLWVRVTEMVGPGRYVGAVSRGDARAMGLRLGDLVTFGVQHIIMLRAIQLPGDEESE